jgi:hypothetical protein
VQAGPAIGFGVKSTGSAPKNKTAQLREALPTAAGTPALAGGTLTLSDLQVRTNDVAFDQLVAQPTPLGPAGKASLPPRAGWTPLQVH